MSSNTQNINLFLTQEHPCNYIEKQMAQNIITDPQISPNLETYSYLVKQGYRRSGANIYRPHCIACKQCKSTRVDINCFKPKTSQKRCLQKNSQISVKIKKAIFDLEHYQLYCRYLKNRHQDGGMDNPSEEDYMNFLSCSWSQTQFVEFRENNKLIAIAVTDVLSDGLSAVYTFFDPETKFNKRSLGVYAILWQIEECKKRGLNWLYLGYWIKDNQKMSYKNQYQPAEHFVGEQWMAVSK